MTRSVLCFFLTVPLVGLQCLIMAFPGHYTHSLLFYAYVHLMNLDSTYVTLVLLGLEDDSTSLLLGDQSQSFKNLCMSGMLKIWSKVSRYTC